MAGTRIGGLKARDKNLASDPNFYKKIGKVGGAKGRTGGFYVNRELASTAGRKGGLISKRGPATYKRKKAEPVVETPVERPTPSLIKKLTSWI